MKRFYLIFSVFLIPMFFILSCQPPQQYNLEGLKSEKSVEEGLLLQGGVTGGTSVVSRMSGAIFTTTVDGGIVNENVRYEAKEDVYLDGGPGPNAPAKAAGLPEGDYYFQVTDPSGKDLLSSDHISARMVHINAAGVIDTVYPGTDYYYKNGQDAGWKEVPVQHAQGVDLDHPELGAVTVQLYPYDDTPNPGGVYKVWLTPVDMYQPLNPFISGPDAPRQQAVNGEYYEAGNFHGFVPAWSKTDNFKVSKRAPKVEPPEITVRKFHDRNMNGIWDTGEEEIFGWLVDYASTIDMGFDYTQFVILAAEPDDYLFTEAVPAGVIQTVAILDDMVQSAYPTADSSVSVTISADYSNKADQELHSVIYGNVGTGSVVASKIYDRNANGTADSDEPGIPGWKFILSGVTVTGEIFGPVTLTADANGAAAYSGLLPGDYTLEELIPVNGSWFATGDMSLTFTITSILDGAELKGSSFYGTFTNYMTKSADFGTKGYWHNKNGLEEIQAAFIDDVNALAPYSTASDYFDAGDEPFDGYWDKDGDGGTDPVAPSYNNEKVIEGIAAGEGTALAEISHFLTDPNAGGDPREQLAQQLLAFLFNVEYRFSGYWGTAFVYNGNIYAAEDLISQAINAWESGSDTERVNIKDLLDALNNTDGLDFIPFMPGPVSF